MPDPNFATNNSRQRSEPENLQICFKLAELTFYFTYYAEQCAGVNELPLIFSKILFSKRYSTQFAFPL